MGISKNDIGTPFGSKLGADIKKILSNLPVSIIIVIALTTRGHLRIFAVVETEKIMIGFFTLCQETLPSQMTL